MSHKINCTCTKRVATSCTNSSNGFSKQCCRVFWILSVNFLTLCNETTDRQSDVHLKSEYRKYFLSPVPLTWNLRNYQNIRACQLFMKTRRSQKPGSSQNPNVCKLQTLAKSGILRRTGLLKPLAKIHIKIFGHASCLWKPDVYKSPVLCNIQTFAKSRLLQNPEFCEEPGFCLTAHPMYMVITSKS